jgi:hypothetical protein
MTVVGLLPCEIGHVTIRPSNNGLCVGQGECVYFGCASFISLSRTHHILANKQCQARSSHMNPSGSVVRR